MENYYQYDQYRIHYKIIGAGHCVVLLHGYLENLDIWNGFADELSKHYQVLTLDTPQHGKSECKEEVDSMEKMADCVNAVLNHLNISNALIVGHSMGGYVALAFAELFPQKTAGICLFHSTPNADSAEKKQSRIQEVELVRKGKKRLIVENGVPLRFSSKNLSNLSHEVERAMNMALTTSDIGTIGALRAMAFRPDRNHVIQNAVFPTMMIFGSLDNHIPLSLAHELANRHKKTRTVILSNSGHIGFIEERDQALNAISSFLAAVFS